MAARDSPGKGLPRVAESVGAMRALAEQLETEVASDLTELELRHRRAGLEDIGHICNTFRVGTTRLSPVLDSLLLERARLRQAQFLASLLLNMALEGAFKAALSAVLHCIGSASGPSGDASRDGYLWCLSQLDAAADPGPPKVSSALLAIAQESRSLLQQLLDGSLTAPARCQLEAQLCSLAATCQETPEVKATPVCHKLEELYCYASSYPL